MTLQEIVAEIAKLTPPEREELMQILAGALKNEPPVRNRQFLDFLGVGAYARDDTRDPQNYINQLRDEWGQPSEP